MLGYGLCSKLEIFVLTFLSYSSIHSLRTAYSFSKQHIAHAINSDKSLLGLVDTLMLLFLGFGFFYHALYPTKRPVRNLTIALLLCSVSYALIPFAIDHNLNNIYTILILMSFNGFVQSFTWSNLLMIVNSRWDRKRDSTALGFWVTNGNIGNILGYFVCEQVQSWGLPWQDQMYLAALVTFSMGVLVFWRVKELQIVAKGNQLKIGEQIPQQKQQKPSILTLISKPSVLLVTATLSCVKSIIYGLMLWLPLYFQNIGLSQYSTYIPITYDITCIIGSVALGYLFSKVNIKGFLLAPLMLVLVGSFYVLKYLQVDVKGYFLLISLVGVCLGGSFNTIVGLSTIQLTKSVPEKDRIASLGFYSAVTMALANFVTAFTQLLIGFVVGKDEQRIFLVFLGYSILGLIGFIYQIFVQISEHKAIQVSQKKIN